MIPMRTASSPADKLFDESRLAGEVMRGKEACADAVVCRRAQTSSQFGIGQHVTDGPAERGQIARVVDEDAALVMDDLVLYATHPRGDDRPVLPHGLGHRQAEPSARLFCTTTSARR